MEWCQYREPYSYGQRALPYIEDMGQYHRYEVVGDFTKLEQYVQQCKNGKLKDAILKHISRWHNGDFQKIRWYRGKIAGIEGWGPGGGIQYQFPLPVDWLEKLGVIREIR